jgi:hypothetical protein
MKKQLVDIALVKQFKIEFILPVEIESGENPDAATANAAALEYRPALVVFLENFAVQFVRNEIGAASIAVKKLYPRISQAIEEDNWKNESTPQLVAVANAVRNIAYNWADIGGSGYISHPRIMGEVQLELVPDLLQTAISLADERGLKELGSCLAEIYERWTTLFN